MLPKLSNSGHYLVAGHQTGGSSHVVHNEGCGHLTSKALAIISIPGTAKPAAWKGRASLPASSAGKGKAPPLRRACCICKNLRRDAASGRSTRRLTKAMTAFDGESSQDSTPCRCLSASSCRGRILACTGHELWLPSLHGRESTVHPTTAITWDDSTMPGLLDEPQCLQIFSAQISAPNLSLSLSCSENHMSCPTCLPFDLSIWKLFPAALPEPSF